MVDASDFAVGGALHQLVDGSWEPMAFYSKRLQPAEERYSTFGRELLAMYQAVRHFRYHLEGRAFTIFTDHNPLTFSLKTPSDRLNASLHSLPLSRRTYSTSVEPTILLPTPCHGRLSMSSSSRLISPSLRRHSQLVLISHSSWKRTTPDWCGLLSMFLSLLCHCCVISLQVHHGPTFRSDFDVPSSRLSTTFPTRASEPLSACWFQGTFGHPLIKTCVCGLVNVMPASCRRFRGTLLPPCPSFCLPKLVLTMYILTLSARCHLATVVHIC